MGRDAIRSIHRMTPVGVRNASADTPDGGGLLLRVKADGGAAWVLRFTSPTGMRREMGLGVCHRQSQALAGESLTHARKLAADARAMIDQGIDPLTARDDRRAELLADEARAKASAATKRDVEHWTLARCARDYHERVIEPKLTTKHAAQWIASLENHVPAALWHAPIVTITAPVLVAALLAIKAHKRARQFVIEACLAHAQGDKVRAAYNRASFDDERRALLQAWGDFVARPAAPVIALHAA